MLFIPVMGTNVSIMKSLIMGESTVGWCKTTKHGDTHGNMRKIWTHIMVN